MERNDISLEYIKEQRWLTFIQRFYNLPEKPHYCSHTIFK